jgi:hypothetical protein
MGDETPIESRTVRIETILFGGVHVWMVDLWIPSPEVRVFPPWFWLWDPVQRLVVLTADCEGVDITRVPSFVQLAIPRGLADCLEPDTSVFDPPGFALDPIDFLASVDQQFVPVVIFCAV